MSAFRGHSARSCGRGVSWRCLDARHAAQSSRSCAARPNEHPVARTLQARVCPVVAPRGVVAQQGLGLRALVAAEGDDRCRLLTPLSESRTAAHPLRSRLATQAACRPRHLGTSASPRRSSSPGLILASNVILGMCDMPQKVTLFRSTPCSWSCGQFLSCENASLGTSRGEREPFSIFTRMTLANFTLTHASTVRSSALGSPAQRNRRTSSCASDKSWMRRPSRPIDRQLRRLPSQDLLARVQGTAADLAMRNAAIQLRTGGRIRGDG